MASVAQVTEATFEGRFKDAMSAGADAAAASMENLGEKTESAGTQIEATEQKVTRAGPTWNSLGRRYDENALLAQKTADANKRLAAEIDTARAAVGRNGVTVEDAEERIRRATIARDRAVVDAQRSAEKLRDTYGSLNDNQAKVGASAKVTAQQFAQLTPQLNDFFVQVASGQGVLMPLIQQGPQIAQIFGGVGETFRTVAATIGPVRLAAGAMGLALVAVTAIANSHTAEMALLGVQLRGVAAEYGGVTAAAKASADAVARAGIGVGRSEALAVQPTLRRAASANQVGGLDFTALTVQAKDLSTILGTDLTEAVGRFTAGMRDPVSLVDELSRQGFPSMNEGVRLAVERLRDAGKSGEGFSLAMRALSADTQGAARDALSPMGRALEDVKAAFGGIWSDIKNGLSGPGASVLTWFGEVLQAAQRFRQWNIDQRNGQSVVDMQRQEDEGRARTQGFDTSGNRLPVQGPVQGGQYTRADLQEMIRQEAVRQNVPVEYVQRIARNESTWRQWDSNGEVLNNQGAIGLFQLRRAAATDAARTLGMSPEDRMSLAGNIRLGVQYAGQMLNASGGDQRDAAARYYQGDNGWSRALSGQNPSVLAAGRAYQAGFDKPLTLDAATVTVQAERATYTAPSGPDMSGGDATRASRDALALPDALDRALKIARGEQGFRVTGDTREAKAESARGLLGDVNAGLALAGTAEQRDRLTQAQRNLNAEIERGLDPQDRMIRQAREYADQANALSPAQASLNAKMVEYDRSLREIGEAPDPAKRAEYMAEVLRGMQGPYRQAMEGARLATEGQQRLGEAYGQGAEALMHAQNTERAMDEVRKQGIQNVTAQTVGVQDLANRYDNLTRAQNANAQRAANDNAQRNLDLLQKEGDLIGVAADQRERELAVFKARQDAAQRPGAKEEDVQRAEALARQTVDQRNRNQQLENSWNELSRIGEQAFDRIGNAITEAFANGSIKAINFGSIAKAVFSEIIQAGLRLAIINPVLNSVFGGNRGTLGGAVTAVGQGSGGVGIGAAAAGGGSYLDYAKKLGGAFDSSFFGGTETFGSGIVGKFDQFAQTNVAGFLDAPLYSTGLNAGLSSSAANNLAANGFTYVGDASMGAVGTSTLAGTQGGVSVGQAAGGVLGVAGGAFGIYSGIQQGGARGAANVVSGAAGVAGGAATLAGGAAAGGIIGGVATVAPYIAIIAAVVAMMLPAQKPSDRTGTAEVTYADNGIQIGGLEGDRYSEENRSFARQVGESLQKVADQIGSAYGINTSGKMLVSAGSRDGLVLRNGDTNYDFDTNAEGVSGLIKKATALMLAENKSQLTGDLRTVADTVGTDDPDKLLKALDFAASTYKAMTAPVEEATVANSAFSQSLKAMRDPWDEAIKTAREYGLATETLAARQAEATTKMVEARDRTLADIMQTQSDRVLVAGGGNTFDRQLENYLRAQDAARTAAADQVRSLGVAEDTVNAVLAAMVRASDAEVAEMRRQSLVARETSRFGLLDRQAQADGTGATLDGQLATYDRRAWLERQQAARDGVTDMVALERTQAAERLAIQRQFGEQAAQQAAAQAAANDNTRTEFWSTSRSLEGRGYLNDLIGLRSSTDAADGARRAAGLGQGQIDTLYTGQVNAVLGGLTSAQLADVATSMAALDPTVAALARAMVDNTRATEEATAREGAAGTAVGVVSSLADYARGLRTGDASPLSATRQYEAAMREFQATAGAAQAGDWTSITRLQGYSDTLLNASRAVNGSGAGYVADFDRVQRVLGSIADLGADRLTASVLAMETRTQTQALLEELQRLRAEVAGLRSENRQAAGTPPVAVGVAA